MSVAASASSSVKAGAGLARAAARKSPFALGDDVDRIASSVERRANQTETIIAGIIVGATLLIGFFIVDALYDAGGVHTIVSDPANNSLSADQNSTLGRIGDGMLIGGVVIIVLFAAIILRVLRGL